MKFKLVLAQLSSEAFASASACHPFECTQSNADAASKLKLGALAGSIHDFSRFMQCSVHAWSRVMAVPCGTCCQ